MAVRAACAAREDFDAAAVRACCNDVSHSGWPVLLSSESVPFVTSTAHMTVSSSWCGGWSRAMRQQVLRTIRP